MRQSRSFRQRPIDVYKKMPVLVESKLTYYDEQGSQQTVHINECQELNELKHDDKESDHHKPKVFDTDKSKKIEIPAPKVYKVKSYYSDVQGGYQPPASYIRSRVVKKVGQQEGLMVDTKVEYDLTYEDEQWLNTHPIYGEDGDPRFRVDESMLERMIFLMEVFCHQTDRIITVDDTVKLFVERLGLEPKAGLKLVVDLHEHWMTRRARINKPLLRKYWPPTADTDNNPHHVFRPREKKQYTLRRQRKNDMDSLQKILQLREDFGRLSKLLELVQDREQMKRDRLDLIYEIFKQRLHEAAVKESARKEKGSYSPKFGSDRDRQAQIQSFMEREVPNVDRWKKNLELRQNVRQKRREEALKKHEKKADEEVSEEKNMYGDECEADLLKGIRAGRRLQDNTDFTTSFFHPVECLPLYANTAPHLSRAPGSGVPSIPTFPPEKVSEPVMETVLAEAGSFASNLVKKVYRGSGARGLMTMSQQGRQRAQKRKNIAQQTLVEHARKRRMFRTRGRVGRGGRIMIQRVPLSVSLDSKQERQFAFRRPRSVYATPHPSRSAGDFMDWSKPADVALVRLGTRSIGNFALNVSRDRLEEIYAMSDGEDEKVIEYSAADEQEFPAQYSLTEYVN